MVDELRGARLLRGYRGAPPADEAALRDVLLRVSALLEVAPRFRSSISIPSSCSVRAPASPTRGCGSHARLIPRASRAEY